MWHNRYHVKPVLLYFDSKTSILFFENIVSAIILLLFQVCYASWSGWKRWICQQLSSRIPGHFTSAYDPSGILDRRFNPGTVPANPGRLARLVERAHSEKGRIAAEVCRNSYREKQNCKIRWCLLRYFVMHELQTNGRKTAFVGSFDAQWLHK
jgi:hypothetical protein